MAPELYYLKRGNGESCEITGEILSHRLQGTGGRGRGVKHGNQFSSQEELRLLGTF